MNNVLKGLSQSLLHYTGSTSCYTITVSNSTNTPGVSGGLSFPGALTCRLSPWPAVQASITAEASDRLQQSCESTAWKIYKDLRGPPKHQRWVPVTFNISNSRTKPLTSTRARGNDHKAGHTEIEMNRKEIMGRLCDSDAQVSIHHGRFKVYPSPAHSVITHIVTVQGHEVLCVPLMCTLKLRNIQKWRKQGVMWGRCG